MAQGIQKFSSKQDEPGQAQAGAASHQRPLLTPALAAADPASFMQILLQDIPISVILGLGHYFNDFD